MQKKLLRAGSLMLFYTLCLVLWSLHGLFHFDWSASSLLWVGLGGVISWYAHQYSCWTTFWLLLAHMLIEWVDVGLHGFAHGWAGIIFLAHVPLDPALMWVSLRGKLPPRQRAVLIAVVLLGLATLAAIIAATSGGHHHHHNHQHSGALAFMSWAGVMVCLGWHLRAATKGSEV